LLVNKWKELTDEEKVEFINKAQEDKKRYEEEIEKFNQLIDKVKIKTVDEKKSKHSGKIWLERFITFLKTL